MQTIEIIYIATNGYLKYLCEYFLPTIKYFFPNDKKILRILTNCPENVPIINDENITQYEVIPIFDIIYPCINLNKTYIISQLKPTNADYIFYFDADTMFQDKPNYNWEKLKNVMDKGGVIIPKHPHYLNLEIVADEWLKWAMTDEMTERSTNSSAYIEDKEYDYVISSLWGAKQETMYALCQKITEMIRKDMKRENGYHIPLYMDENYFNKLILLSKKENIGFDFYVQHFCELYDNKNTVNDNVFCYQKQMNYEYKTNRQ